MKLITNRSLKLSFQGDLKMNKITRQTTNVEEWNPQASYEKIGKIINQWPNWKKDAYNKMFAISTHAKRLNIE